MFKWLDFDIVHPEDRYDLERDAAKSELEGVSRLNAEQYAYQRYLKIKHLEGAGHHLVGMIENKAKGNMKDANKHFSMYVLHLGHLGKTVNDPVSPDIVTHQPLGMCFERFIPHPTDALIGANCG